MMTNESPREAGKLRGPEFSLFAIGFRPFFLGASIYACLGMGAWLVAYQQHQIIGTTLFGAPHWWHAHGMIFGFATGVTAGFLLTAVRNWTGIPTCRGTWLGLLFSLWALARFLPHVGAHIAVVALVDLLFNLCLTGAIARPLLRAKRWKDLATFPTKLFTLTIANACVYLGAIGWGPGQRFGLHMGLYVLLALIMTIGNRVFPFFIRRALQCDDNLKTPKFLALANLLAVILFMCADLIWPSSVGAAVFAAMVAILNAKRLWGWARPAVWTHPLVWVLILGYGWIVVGFAMFAVQPFGLFSPLLPLHALAAGGIGLTTMGMMARVALGHTGRDIYASRPILGVCFGLLMMGATTRICLPLVWDSYASAILISQVLWVTSFAFFVCIYAPILMRPRVDGKPE